MAICVNLALVGESYVKVAPTWWMVSLFPVPLADRRPRVAGGSLNDYALALLHRSAYRPGRVGSRSYRSQHRSRALPDVLGTEPTLYQSPETAPVPSPFRVDVTRGS